MELRIVHETCYDYAAPVMLAQHHLVGEAPDHVGDALAQGLGAGAALGEGDAPVVFVVVAVGGGGEFDPEQHGLSDEKMHAMQRREHHQKSVHADLSMFRRTSSLVDRPQAVTLNGDKQHGEQECFRQRFSKLQLTLTTDHRVSFLQIETADGKEHRADCKGPWQANMLRRFLTAKDESESHSE